MLLLLALSGRSHEGRWNPHFHASGRAQKLSNGKPQEDMWPHHSDASKIGLVEPSMVPPVVGAGDVGGRGDPDTRDDGHAARPKHIRRSSIPARGNPADDLGQVGCSSGVIAIRRYCVQGRADIACCRERNRGHRGEWSLANVRAVLEAGESTMIGWDPAESVRAGFAADAAGKCRKRVAPGLGTYSSSGGWHPTRAVARPDADCSHLGAEIVSEPQVPCSKYETTHGH